MPQPAPVNPRVLRVVVAALLFGTILAFVILFGYFYLEIWEARRKEPPATKPPSLDADLMYVATTIGATLGTYFATVLGIQKKDPNEETLALGNSILPGGRTLEVLGTSAFVIYFAVGVGAIVTALYCKVQSPDIIKTVAATFAGYAFALLVVALLGGSAPPPPPPQPPAPQPPAES